MTPLPDAEKRRTVSLSQTERERVESYPKDGKEEDEEIFIRSERCENQAPAD